MPSPFRYYETIEVNTYLKNGDDFIPFQDFNYPIKDYEYIEGAIELIINGRELLSKSMWDYVDILWAYIIDGLKQLSEGKDFSTNFPDQPLGISVTHLHDNKLQVTVDCHGKKSAVVDKYEFINALKAEARCFLAAMTDIVPRNNADYVLLIDQVDAVVNTKYSWHNTNNFTKNQIEAFN